MFNRWFKRVLCFVLLTSCQTIETTNIRYFKGFFNVEKNGRKQNYPVEIYADSTKPILQINILTPLGGIFASYLWKNQEHQILIPSRKQYFKQAKWPSNFPFQKLIQEPSWLYQALLQQWSKNWHCEKTSQKSQQKKCEKNDFVIEWEKKFFQKEQMQISFKKEGLSSTLTQYKNSSDISLDIKIPEGFQRVSTMDLLQ